MRIIAVAIPSFVYICMYTQRSFCFVTQVAPSTTNYWLSDFVTAGRREDNRSDNADGCGWFFVLQCCSGEGKLAYVLIYDALL